MQLIWLAIYLTVGIVALWASRGRGAAIIRSRDARNQTIVRSLGSHLHLGGRHTL